MKCARCNGSAEINIDLGHTVLLDGLEFTFYLGKDRSHNMKIMTSADGKKFSTVFDGASQGKKESVKFSQVEARYIKILANGNNKNSWNSYYEVVPLISTVKKHKNRYEKIGAGEE